MGAARIARLELWVQLADGTWDCKDTIIPSEQESGQTSKYKCIMLLRNNPANKEFIRKLPFRIYMIMKTSENRNRDNLQRKPIRPVVTLDAEGQVVKKYQGGRDAERKALLNLEKALYGPRTRAGGWIWLFEDELHTDFMHAQIKRFKEYDEKVLKRNQ